MARYIGPKEKIERRLGKKLFLKGERSLSSKSATVRRMYPPGMHGKKPSRRQSEYGLQFASKQRVRQMYRMLEKQFKNWMMESIHSNDETVNSIMQRLEHRLDNVVYRSGVAQSRDQARQVVNHGHITVNGKKVGIPSYSVNKGDIIEVREGSKKSKFFSALVPQWVKNVTQPAWLTLDSDKLITEIVGSPTMEESGIDPADLRAIVEFYSR